MSPKTSRSALGSLYVAWCWSVQLCSDAAIPEPVKEYWPLVVVLLDVALSYSIAARLKYLESTL